MATSTRKLKPRRSEAATLIPMNPSLGLTTVNGRVRSLRLSAVAHSTAPTRRGFPATMRKDVPKAKKKKMLKAAQDTPMSLVCPTPASTVKRTAKSPKRGTSAKRSKKAPTVTPAAIPATPATSRRRRSIEAPASAPVPSRRRRVVSKKKSSAKKPVKRLQGRKRTCVCYC